MTCIAIATDGENIVMGGDSAGVGGSDLTIRKDRKVFQRTGLDKTKWVFGFTTSFRMGELIQYELTLPKVDARARKDLYGFMVKKFIFSLRKCFKKGGWAEREKGRESGGTFIIGLLGRIFVIYNDYQVEEPMDPFGAVGCGSDAAKGSLYTSQKDRNLKRRVHIALEAAQRFSTGVRKPFVFVKLGS
ncbi:MAG: hypothetical protein HZA35_02970 [Parcubacteria group bacterium]|nr:hypothetical protein [Parcubacteria group bacterium]